MKKRIVSALPAFAVMIMIFYFSDQHSQQSNESSDYIVGKLTEVIEEIRGVIGMEPAQSGVNLYIDALKFVVRKLAHTMEYALLGFCISFYLFQREYHIKRCFLQSLLTGFFYACTDEIHQYFVPGRSCEFRDVLIDTNGVFLGTITFFFVVWCVKRKVKRSL